jgi:AraC-like DNA-binding protein/mannose-6-phosphate isomerase-like protein (cupin superfamily)
VTTTNDLRAPSSARSVDGAERDSGTWIRRLDPDEPSGWGIQHRRQHQIVWVAQGAATARVGDRKWVLPPTQAIWIPSGMPHDLVIRRPSTLHRLFVSPDECPLEWREPVVLAITPMLRDLLLTVSAPGVEQRVSDAAETLLFALLKPLSQTPLQLPLPTDYRAAALAQAVLSRPSDRRTLDEWADHFETSAGGLRRAFVQETGLTFSEWRTRSRLRASLSLLAGCVPVDTVASKVGFASTSAFVDAFRRLFGHTPGRCVKARRS